MSIFEIVGIVVLILVVLYFCCCYVLNLMGSDQEQEDVDPHEVVQALVFYFQNCSPPDEEGLMLASSLGKHLYTKEEKKKLKGSKKN